MGSDGRILSQGSISEVNLDEKLAKEMKADEELLKKADDTVDESKDEVNKPADGKLIVAEEVDEGHVSWSACKLPFRKTRYILFLTITSSGDVFLRNGRKPPHPVFLLVRHGNQSLRSCACHTNLVLGVLGFSI